MTVAAAIDPAIVRQFPPAKRYLIGVSGGRDSMTLLHLLVAHGYRHLVVCHLNHRLRGRAAAADAKFVARAAAAARLECIVESANVRALAAKTKQSIETAARNARYEFFAKCAPCCRCHAVFLGHHADDLVETFLMNLFRGAGSSGLSSIRPVAKRQIGDTELTIVRPLLHVWRSELDGFAARHQIEFREDESNRDLAAIRNRIRHRVIPYLERTFDRKVRQNIWRAATIAAEQESELRTRTPAAVRGALPLHTLRDMSVALQRRTLRDWLRASEVSAIGFDLIERVRALLEPDVRNAKTNLPRGRHVRRRAGKLFIE